MSSSSHSKNANANCGMYMKYRTIKLVHENIYLFIDLWCITLRFMMYNITILLWIILPYHFWLYLSNNIFIWNQLELASFHVYYIHIYNPSTIFWIFCNKYPVRRFLSVSQLSNYFWNLFELTQYHADSDESYI